MLKIMLKSQGKINLAADCLYSQNCYTMVSET